MRRASLRRARTQQADADEHAPAIQSLSVSLSVSRSLAASWPSDAPVWPLGRGAGPPFLSYYAASILHHLVEENSLLKPPLRLAQSRLSRAPGAFGSADRGPRLAGDADQGRASCALWAGPR